MLLECIDKEGSAHCSQQNSEEDLIETVAAQVKATDADARDVDKDDQLGDQLEDWISIKEPAICLLYTSPSPRDRG